MVIIKTPVGIRAERRKRLGLSPGVYDFPSFIITTVRASLVRLFHFVTVGALGKGWCDQKVVRAPLVFSGV
jgi:hypothetical protein